MKLLVFFISLGALVAPSLCSDITNAVFGKEVDGMPAAFGDFNSDELTDLFVLTKESKTVQILLASNEEPLLQPMKKYQCEFERVVTSVVPGDFDGDVFMDVMVTTFVHETKLTNVYILWGGNRQLNCTNEKKPILKMIGEPLAMDYNKDMIIDLFGSDENGTRTFWIFNSNRTAPFPIIMEKPKELDTMLAIKEPHANAFLDLNNDFLPDLVVTTEEYFEIWHGVEEGFKFHKKISTREFVGTVGQSLHLDVELMGKMDLLLPICKDKNCKTSSIMIYDSNKWQELPVDFKDSSNELWSFVMDGQRYTNTITMRGGDFNMDGYPDLLATLKSTTKEQTRSFLLENVACETSCGSFNRTFKVRWNALSPFYNDSVMAVFYDFYQDGTLKLDVNDIYL